MWNCTAVRFFYFRNNTVWFGAVLILLRIVRCGAVRFSPFQNHTVRYGTIFSFSKSYGAVRIIFFKNRTVPCDRTVPCGAVIRRIVVSYGAVERAL